MNIEQINARLAEIRSLCDDPNADIAALTQEANSLLEQRTNLLNAEAQRQSLRNLVADGAGATIRDLRNLGAPTNENTAETYDVSSAEYRSAWLKHMARDNQGAMLLGEMNQEERAAFTVTTENTGVLVPTDIQNRIVELVRGTSPLLADATASNFARGFGVPRHKSIKQGDAAVTGEAVANEDEEDVFDLLALDGEEIKKHIEMSKKMQVKSIDAFADWITTHLAKRIRIAKERLIIERLNSDEVGIAAENKPAAAPLTDDSIRAAMALIKADGVRSVYANNLTIWTKIAALKDDEGKKLFVPNSMVDPVVQGRIYGAAVKLDTEVPDDVIYIGVGSSILINDFEELEIVPSVEPKTLKRIFTAYSLFDAGLEDPEAFVKMTVSE